MGGFLSAPLYRYGDSSDARRKRWPYTPTAIALPREPNAAAVQ